MNKVKTFINEELKKLHNKFDNLRIKYAFNKEIEVHIVEITPQTEYNNNINLDNAWIDITIEFMKLFPYEEISFISDDSLLNIANPEFTLEPIVKLEYNSVFDSLTYDTHFTKNKMYPHYELNFEMIMKEALHSMPSYSIVMKSIIDKSLKFDLKPHKVALDNSNLLSYKIENNSQTTIPNTQYAMAA